MVPEQVIAANPNSMAKISFNASDLKIVSDVTSFHNIKLKSVCLFVLKSHLDHGLFKKHEQPC